MNTLYVTIGPLDLLDKEASVNLRDEDAGKKQEGYVVVVKKKHFIIYIYRMLQKSFIIFSCIQQPVPFLELTV